MKFTLTGMFVILIAAAVAQAATVTVGPPPADFQKFQAAIEANRGETTLTLVVTEGHNGGRVRPRTSTVITPAMHGGRYRITGGDKNAVDIVGKIYKIRSLVIIGATITGKQGVVVDADDPIDSVELIDCQIWDTKFQGIYLDNVGKAIRLTGNHLDRCGKNAHLHRGLYIQVNCTQNVISRGNLYSRGGGEQQYRTGVDSVGDVFVGEGVAAGVVRGQRDPIDGGVAASFENLTVARAGWFPLDLGNLNKLDIKDVFVGWSTGARGGGPQEAFQLTGVGEKDYATIPFDGDIIDAADITIASTGGLFKLRGQTPNAAAALALAITGSDRAEPAGIDAYVEDLRNGAAGHTIAGLRTLIRGEGTPPPVDPPVDPPTGDLAERVEALEQAVEALQGILEFHRLSGE